MRWVGGVLLVVACVAPAHAWSILDVLPFPSGRATVVAWRFCLTEDCVLFCPDLACQIANDVAWQSVIRRAAHAWNQAGADFHFTVRDVAEEDFLEVCHPPSGEVFVYVTGGETVCADDPPLGQVHAQMVSADTGGVRVYVNAAIPEHLEFPEGVAFRLVLHELGHAVGLDHPDEVGQDLPAVMNSRVVHVVLQPDDLAGIAVLYGRKQHASAGEIQACDGDVAERE